MDQLLADERIPRGFRVKFPEEVLQENLGGQLWFGAECLAAGSSIMHREAESTAMRPLAQAVTKSLENVRNLLRHQCLTNNIPNSDRLHLDINDPATEQLYESLKIFDRLFAEFELKYVSAMTQVKSKHEYEMQEMICVLFSESLQRALKIGLLEQEQVDEFDPPLMFSIPRIAIICGLIVYPDGPLNMDVVADELSEMFRPFRAILIKIRDLLKTLSPNELFSLEKLLCTNEDKNLSFTKLTTNDETKKAEDKICINNNNNYPLTPAAAPPTDDDDELPEEYDSSSEEEKYGNDSTSTDVDEWSDDHSDTYDDVEGVEGTGGGFLMANTNLGNLFQTTDHGPLAAVDNFITCDQITQIIGNSENVNNNNEENLTIYNPSCSTNVPTAYSPPSSTESVQITLRRSVDLPARKHYTSTTNSITNSVGSNSSSESSYSSMKCNNGRRLKGGGRRCKSISEKEIIEKDRLIEERERIEREKLMSARMKFKNTENLLHRLFVCIAGVADQLQTNFASDLRHILRSVFLMNISTSEEEEAPKETENSSKDTENLYEFLASENDVVQRGNNNDDDDIDDSSQNVYSAEEVNPESDLSSSGEPKSEVSEHVNGNDIESVINNNHGREMARKNSNPSTSSTFSSSSNRSSPANNNNNNSNTRASPPIWIPDQEAPSCMGCTTQFTAFRRRHHCRNCGRVFCGSCSNTSAPLPKFGLIKAVRVCRQCYITEAAAAANSL
ncbi:ZFYVE28 family protein [Megaselia abdita]